MMPEQEDLLRKASESVRAAKLLADKEFYDFSASRAARNTLEPALFQKSSINT